MNTITFEIKSPDHAKLAAEFMARFFALDNPEAVFHYNLANEVKAEMKADAAIEKAAKKSKTKPDVQPATEPEVVPAVVPTPAVEAAPVSAIDKASLQKLAQSKSNTVGVQLVKETIAKFGGKNINETSPEQFEALKEALEALV